MLSDDFLEEYFWRPSGIVCYSSGVYGGVRAAMQLRVTLAELGMPSISSILPFGRVGATFSEDGVLQDEAAAPRTKRFLDELEWFACALAAERAKGTPYRSSAGVAPAERASARMMSSPTSVSGTIDKAAPVSISGTASHAGDQAGREMGINGPTIGSGA